MKRALLAEIKKSANFERAKTAHWFFKTKKGEYGYGDRFLGLTMPQSRALARKYVQLPLADVVALLKNPYHDIRMIALVIITLQYAKAGVTEKKKIVDCYLAHTKYINNWDLVDVSVYKILGDYLRDRPRRVLYRLAASDNLWERRMAMVATLAFIKDRDLDDTFALAERLLRDRHDLIHKACGWMLREAGIVDEKRLLSFLDRYASTMPRTMLRYALERLPETKRHYYLTLKT